MSKKSTYHLISWIVVFIWMALIFFLSHQPATASSELSSGVVQIVVGVIKTIMPFIDYEPNKLHFFIRKGAHFFAYFMLGILVLNALSFGRDLTVRSVVFTFLICVMYAISDEVHQLFISGRSGEVRDVLIDSAGASVGIGFYSLIKWVSSRFFSKTKLV